MAEAGSARTTTLTFTPGDQFEDASDASVDGQQKSLRRMMSDKMAVNSLLRPASASACWMQRAESCTRVCRDSRSVRLQDEARAQMFAVVAVLVTARCRGMVQGLFQSLAYAPDGKSFATGDSERCVTVWAQQGQAIAKHVTASLLIMASHMYLDC